MSQRDGRLCVHNLDVVGTEPELECQTYQLSDPRPVTTQSSRGVSGTSAKLIYLWSGKFCIVQAAAERRGAEADHICDDRDGFQGDRFQEVGEVQVGVSEEAVEPGTQNECELGDLGVGARAHGQGLRVWPAGGNYAE